MSHTYSILPVSQSAFNEISRKLKEAGYTNAFDGPYIDMHGIALEAEAEKPSALKLALKQGLKKDESSRT
jgi:hypothetical protein